MFNFLTQPKGPKVTASTETVTLTFSGTKVSFKAPGYSYAMIDQDDDDRLPTEYDLDDFSLYGSTLHQTFDEHLYNPEIDIAGFGCYTTAWGFRKPLLGNKYDRGTLSFLVGVDHIARFGSLFKPRNMEKAIIESIDLEFGPQGWLAGEGCGGRRFKGPLNWQIQHFNGRDWVGYFIHKLWRGRGGEIFWSIPLTETHFLRFTFDDTGYPSEKMVNVFNKLAKDVVSSCKIEYSNTVQQQIKQAEADGLGEPYSAHREAQAWEEYDREPEKYELPGTIKNM